MQSRNEKVLQNCHCFKYIYKLINLLIIHYMSDLIKVIIFCFQSWHFYEIARIPIAKNHHDDFQ